MTYTVRRESEDFMKELKNALNTLSVDDLINIVTSVGVELRIRANTSRNDRKHMTQILHNLKTWEAWGIDDQEV